MPDGSEQSLGMQVQIPLWELSESDGVLKIHRGFRTRNFGKALELLNKIGVVAEEEGHHPDLRVFSYNKAREKPPEPPLCRAMRYPPPLLRMQVLVELTTHSSKGLTENDFIVAAKVDALDLGDLLSKKRGYNDP